MERLKQLRRHLLPQAIDEDSCSLNLQQCSNSKYISADDISLFAQIVNREANQGAANRFSVDELPKIGEYDISQYLHGPLRDKERYPGGWADVFHDWSESQGLGKSHTKIAKWQKLYAGSLSANIVIPILGIARENEIGQILSPAKRLEVVIADPSDAKRIARLHVQKQPSFTPANFNSIISTTDNEYWAKQREHMIQAFLPDASLRQIFKISMKRAAYCSKRLKHLAAMKSDSVVDINDFFLHETQAQLQLALFGETEEFMNSTNAKIRNAFNGLDPPAYIPEFCRELVARMQNGSQTVPTPREDVMSGRCPVVHGPLSATYREFDDKRPKNAIGNASIFAFAGHDTTGHTLSWLILELSRNKEIQDRLRAEVDTFWDTIGNREPEYKDLERLPFMTRCIMETLRLWPAVANGTFREIQFDDHIKGPDGKNVLIEKGTYVRIVNWSRHRNPDLWGQDADKFNPDREFQNDEIWHGEPFKGYNPVSERFSPFTFPPRACIGMNFAQAEARIILANVLRDFTFDLAPAFQAKFDPNAYFGVNFGTLAPVDITKPELVEGYPGGFIFGKMKPVMGLPMRALPRYR